MTYNMKFKQIVALDDINISDSSMSALDDYSENKVRVFDTDPKDNNEIIERIEDADVFLAASALKLGFQYKLAERGFTITSKTRNYEHNFQAAKSGFDKAAK